MSKDYPTEYNEFVEFIRHNDVSVVAQMLADEYTLKKKDSKEESPESLLGETKTSNGFRRDN